MKRLARPNQLQVPPSLAALLATRVRVPILFGVGSVIAEIKFRNDIDLAARPSFLWVSHFWLLHDFWLDLTLLCLDLMPMKAQAQLFPL